MPVVVIAITVVVRCEAIASSYPGGTEAFEQDVPNNTFATDGELATCSFMVPSDVGAFIQVLEAKGLQWKTDDDDKAKDMCVVDQRGGPCNTCDWIHFGQEGAVSYAWIGTEGATGRELVGPSWWKPENSAKMDFIPQEVVDSGKLVVVEHKEEGDNNPT